MDSRIIPPFTKKSPHIQTNQYTSLISSTIKPTPFLPLNLQIDHNPINTHRLTKPFPDTFLIRSHHPHKRKIHIPPDIHPTNTPSPLPETFMIF
jgi:hypothetical protein